MKPLRFRSTSLKAPGLAFSDSWLPNKDGQQVPASFPAQNVSSTLLVWWDQPWGERKMITNSVKVASMDQEYDLESPPLSNWESPDDRHWMLPLFQTLLPRSWGQRNGKCFFGSYLISLSTEHSLGRSREQLAAFLKTLPHACSPHLPGIERVARLTHWHDAIPEDRNPATPVQHHQMWADAWRCWGETHALRAQVGKSSSG